MDSLHTVFHWNRLKLLQSLCSVSSEDACKRLEALVFIPGPDGRSNPMATRVIKYLFKGAIGADLFDETLDSAYESLEDMILIIEPNCIRVIYTDTMKQVIERPLATFPNVIEYKYWKEEEEDIDRFQLKKCFHFKKAMLEVSAKGGNIGVAVPIGYDNILDIEGWPLLQSFALDQVFTPTGFFTARYNIVDITTQLETIFRTVDCFYLENAASVINGAIAQHMTQFLSVLDTTTVSQRDRMTAEDSISPLEILYEFGEMDAAIPLEQSLKPVLLYGPFSNFVGNVIGPKAAKWKEFYPANSLHAIVEASEPSTGLRWCRTYFLQQGTAPMIYDEFMKLQAALSGINFQSSDSGEEGEESLQELRKLATFPIASSAPSPTVHQALQRLMALYVKLWFHLRMLTYETFLQECDVLAAAEVIQQQLTAIMMATDTADHNNTMFTDVQLLPHEKLQLHMDCLNALGEIISIEDVDDMGGVCWTYIRASVHGIKVPIGNQETSVTIAVGDTFLFAPLSKGDFHHRNDWRLSFGANLLPLLNDTVCMTHTIPYFQAFLGGGLEEEYLRFIHYCSKTSLTSSPLNLGKPIEVVGTNAVNVIGLSNHPLHSYFTTELKLFQEGFILTKLNGLASTPIQIHFNQQDVRNVWTINTVDTFEEALRQVERSTATSTTANSTDWKRLLYAQADQFLPRGILVIFELQSKKGGIGLSELHRSLPGLSLVTTMGVARPEETTSMLALLFPHNDRSGSMVPSILDKWRPSLRLNDVEEFKGKQSYASIHPSILHSYLVLVDGLQIFAPSEGSTTRATGTTADNMTMNVIKAKEILGYAFTNDTRNPRSTSQSKAREEIVANEIVSTESEFSKILAFNEHFSTLGYPGYGSYPMSCMHAVAEARRLSSFDYQSLLFPSTTSGADANPGKEGDSKTEQKVDRSVIKPRPGEPPFQLLVLTGLIGSGIQMVSKQFNRQFTKATMDLLNLPMSASSRMIDMVEIDFTELVALHEGTLSKMNSVEMSECVHAFVAERFRSVGRSFNSSCTSIPVVIVTLINTPLIKMPLQDVLELLTRFSQAPITHVTNITTPDSIVTSHPVTLSLPVIDPRNPVQKESLVTASEEKGFDLYRGLGQETWNGKGLEFFHYYHCQSVILLEANTNKSSAYGQLKLWIEQSQYNLLWLMKVSSFNIYFEEEDLQVYLQICFPNVTIPGMMRQEVMDTLHETRAAKIVLGIPTYEELKRDMSDKNQTGIRYYSDAIMKKITSLRQFTLTNTQLFSSNNTSNHNFFSLTLLLKLLQGLFPEATPMFTNITYLWQHQHGRTTSRQNRGSIPLFLKHAMKKVFQHHELQQMLERFQRQFSRLLQLPSNTVSDSPNKSLTTAVTDEVPEVIPPRTLWGQVQSNIICLQAVLSIDNERLPSPTSKASYHRTETGTTPYRILVEANQGTIIYRELSPEDPLSIASDRHGSVIKVTGTFSDHEELEQYLIQLFQMTEQYTIAIKPLLSREDFLSKEAATSMTSLATEQPAYDLRMMKTIQQLPQYHGRELPSGYWYDGQFYLDHKGQRSELRPDIEEILLDYLQRENEKRRKYNEWLEQYYLSAE